MYKASLKKEEKIDRKNIPPARPTSRFSILTPEFVVIINNNIVIIKKPGHKCYHTKDV